MTTTTQIPTTEDASPRREDTTIWPQIVSAAWNKKAQSLIGRRIVDARFMSEEDADGAGFAQRPIIIALDDGTLLVPQSDDEGNDGGALSVMAEKPTAITKAFSHGVIPTL